MAASLAFFIYDVMPSIYVVVSIHFTQIKIPKKLVQNPLIAIFIRH